MQRTPKKKILIYILGLTTALYGAYACEDSVDNGGYRYDGPVDSAGDVDGDTDTDTDADADTDTDADIPNGDPCAACTGFLGVDLLVVVDNSGSMYEEQQIMATGFFTLVNSLVNPTEDWDYPNGADDVRVAVVSTDMGMQYGGGGAAGETRYCTTDPAGNARSPLGDNAAFQTEMATSIQVQSNQIKCDADASQCPNADWTCQNGLCVAPPSGGTVGCLGLPAGAQWAETAASAPNIAVASQVSCLAQLGTDGCGFEQQLQAGVAALKRDDQTSFVRDNHLLAVIVVSDEEDCSIRSAGLFSSPEWNDPDQANTACNYPPSNEDNFLFDAQYFYNQLIAVKNNQTNAVVFAAIVGVPMGDDSPCQGTGDKLNGCLEHPSMQYIPNSFTTAAGEPYNHFEPACVRTEGGVEVTQARPGRRFVKVAQKFGCTGLVYSICNADWSNAMSEIARLIAKCIVV